MVRWDCSAGPNQLDTQALASADQMTMQHACSLHVYLAPVYRSATRHDDCHGPWFLQSSSLRARARLPFVAGLILGQGPPKLEAMNMVFSPRS